jgi:hypothetical protein
MNWKLFFTLVGAIVVSFLIIRWLFPKFGMPTFALRGPRREIGFAAIAKQREELETQAA